MITVSSAEPSVSAFEFKHRDIIIRLTYFMAIAFYFFDSRMLATREARWLGSHFAVLSLSEWLRAVLFAAAVLTGLGALVRTWGTSYLRGEVMRDKRLHTERLLTDGPFGYSRNPIYFGNFLMALGIGAMLSLSGFIFLLVATVAFLIRLSVREETVLAWTFGPAFEAYRARVPGLIPALTPQIPAGDSRQDWSGAFQAELLVWIIVCAELVYSIALNRYLLWTMIACAFLPGLLRRLWTPKPQASAH